MSDAINHLPGFLNHSSGDTPVPTWEQLTRTVSGSSVWMVEHVTRILGSPGDAELGRETWNLLPDRVQRSVGLMIDKICHEGWLDAVGRISGVPWDGGFFFEPRETSRGTLSEVLDSKSGAGGCYIACRARNGLFAYLTTRNHRGWRQSWIENDTATASLHVGTFGNGIAEVHLDAFNPMFIVGAWRGDLVGLPLVGSYNHRLFRLHRRWEQSECGATVRTSANFYHLMRETVPVSF